MKPHNPAAHGNFLAMRQGVEIDESLRAASSDRISLIGSLTA
jgi:hypothetical protein